MPCFECNCVIRDAEEQREGDEDDKKSTGIPLEKSFHRDPYEQEQEDQCQTTAAEQAHDLPCVRVHIPSGLQRRDHRPAERGSGGMSCWVLYSELLSFSDIKR